MTRVARPGQSPRAAADEVLTVAVKEICRGIEEMIEEEAAAPVYRVEDLVGHHRFTPEQLVGVGGGAPGLAPRVAQALGLTCHLPAAAAVANAIGAAVARPTTQVTLRADTVQGFYTVPELGIRRELSGGRFGREDAWSLAAEHLLERARREGVGGTGGGPAEDLDTERIWEEDFNVVRGFRTMGKILACRLQIKPGVLVSVAGEEGL